MAYEVLKPLTYVREDGKVVHYSKAGATVDDIPAPQVEILLEMEKLAAVDGSEPEPEPEPHNDDGDGAP